MILQQPIVSAARVEQFDIVATVAGGGLSGQAGAVRHGISKALTYFEPGLRAVLKKRSEEHTSELQSLMRISYAVFCLKKKNKNTHSQTNIHIYHHQA